MLLSSVVVSLALLGAAGVYAADAKADAKKEAKTQSWTGEIIDMGCYLGHAATGEKHQECAAKCLAGGMPMGLLVSGNKVFLLMPNHNNGDAFEAAKEWAAKRVTVTGTMMTGGGIQAIEVATAEPAAAAPAKK
jgi:hypothetical protein